VITPAQRLKQSMFPMEQSGPMEVSFGKSTRMQIVLLIITQEILLRALQNEVQARK